MQSLFFLFKKVGDVIFIGKTSQKDISLVIRPSVTSSNPVFDYNSASLTPFLDKKERMVGEKRQKEIFHFNNQ